MEESIAISVIRLFEAVIKTNEGRLTLYVKTDDPDIEDATKKAKEAAKAIFVSHLMKAKEFSWAYLDKVSLIKEEGKDD